MAPRSYIPREELDTPVERLPDIDRVEDDPEPLSPPSPLQALRPSATNREIIGANVLNLRSIDVPLWLIEPEFVLLRLLVSLF